MNTGVTFNLLMRQKISYGKVKEDRLEKIIMSDRQMY